MRFKIDHSLENGDRDSHYARVPKHRRLARLAKELIASFARDKRDTDVDVSVS